MTDHSALTAIVQATQAHEDALPLINENCRSQFLLHPDSQQGVCLFFHGFTATPEQFEPIGKAFFAAGYNVLIPLLPGHGLSGDWDGDNPPPLPEEQQVYKEFGLHWLQQIQALGNKVVIGGLSGGSTLAAWLALEQPQWIERALLFAPYLSNSNKVVDLLVRIFNFYFEWKNEPGTVSFGYGGFVMPALRLFLDMGQDVIERAQEELAAPMFIISSESDRAVGNKDHKDLFEAVLKRQPKAWYHRFDRDLKIPHNMMTKAEGNEHQDLVIAIAKAYVESDLTWAEVEAIGDRMAQGKPFNAVISELHLKQRVSADMSTMMQAYLTRDD